MKSHPENNNSNDKIKIQKSHVILGLSPNIKYSVNELNKKYRIAALKHHPDKNFNSDESNAKFKEINEAYLYLYDVYNNQNSNSYHDKYDEYENESNHCYAKLFSKFVSSLMNKFSKTQISTLQIIIQYL